MCLNYMVCCIIIKYTPDARYIFESEFTAMIRLSELIKAFQTYGRCYLFVT